MVFVLYIQIYNWWGRGGLPFLDTSCPVIDVYIYYVSAMINVCDIVSTFISIARMFLSIDILFEQRIT